MKRRVTRLDGKGRLRAVAILNRASPATSSTDRRDPSIRAVIFESLFSVTVDPSARGMTRISPLPV